MMLGVLRRWPLAPSFLVLCLSCGDEPPPEVPALELSTERLPDARLGVGYDEKVVSRGGEPPHLFDLAAGALPEGLEVVRETGQIRGVPAAPGPFELTIRVADAGGRTASRTLSLYVEPDPLVVTTTALPPAVERTVYRAELEASGGIPPLTWEVLSGALPAGLSLEPGGALAGTPAVFGAFELTFGVRDAEDREARVELRLAIRSLEPMIREVTLPLGRFGETYEVDFEAEGGLEPYTWSLGGGALPPGLSLSAGGRISGVPTESGSFPFTVRVEDAAEHGDEAALELLVIAPLAIETQSLPNFSLGQPGEAQLRASGGLEPYRWILAPQTPLPAGVVLEDDGRLHGTPTEPGDFRVTIRVQDAQGIVRSAQFNLRVRSSRTYQVTPSLSFPPVCGTSTNVSYQTVELEVPDSFAVSETTVTVDLDYTDNQNQNSNTKLKLILWAPDGRRSVLCGNASGLRSERGCEGRSGIHTTYGTTVQPQVPFEVFREMNAQGTWRFQVAVTRPVRDNQGNCRQDGIIREVTLTLEADTSPEPYVIVRGFTRNNLVIHPWVRIRGGGLDQHDIDLTATLWHVGPNGIREGGRGDDVPDGRAFTWSATGLPAGTTVTPDGHVSAGAVTNVGPLGNAMLTASDGNGHSVSLPLLVLPPDWNPRIRQF